MITIMGASGNTGNPLARRLLESGVEVRVLGRSAAKLEPLALAGADVVTGDATDADYLARAFDGADAVYTLLPDDFTSTEHRAWQDRIGEAITKAIRSSGVGHVVFVSSLGADIPEGHGLTEALHAHEVRIHTLTGVNVLILRNGWYFENFFGTLGLIKNQGINGGAVAPDLSIPMIAGRDISEVAAAALRERDFDGIRVQELWGERDLTFIEATRIIGDRIGLPSLQYVQFPYDDYAASLVQAGFSHDVAWLFTEMSRGLNEGRMKPNETRGAANTTPTRFETLVDEV
ncbi:MAG: NAD(P)H-binding protein, partial [Pseudonocardiaceae bacterium]